MRAPSRLSLGLEPMALGLIRGIGLFPAMGLATRMPPMTPFIFLIIQLRLTSACQTIPARLLGRSQSMEQE